ncbi:hypothetical protein [Desulfofalx alkaliphila]|uniref:hypothetical protein n=1 Tax=Desulfofalx alkaliphila TaxID=105483 RepID=UPI0004E108CA|nr:hypothetical protein [Desulfofalx alkaliphila]
MLQQIYCPVCSRRLFDLDGAPEKGGVFIKCSQCRNIIKISFNGCGLTRRVVARRKVKGNVRDTEQGHRT